MTAIRLAWVLFIALTSGLLYAETTPSSAQDKQKNILFLYSYGDGGKGTELFGDGFRAAMSAAGIDVTHLFLEYLDLERSKDVAHYREQLRDLLLKKYAKRKIDIVLTGQQPALNFLLDEGRMLAPTAPLISYQAPLPDPRKLGERRLLSLISQFDIEGTLKYAINLFPATQRVLFVAGSSDADRKMAQSAAEIAAPWRGKLHIEDTVGLTLEQTLQRARQLPPNSIVIFTQYNRDGAGQVTIAYEVEKKIVEAANAPVFGLYDFNLLNGGIGGSVVNVRTSGEKTAQLALDMMSGKLQLTQAMTPMNIGVAPEFNWQQIRRWQGDPRRLPQNSLFIERTPTLWEQYYAHIIALTIFFVLQSATIAALLINRRRRRRAEIALHESEARYRTMVEGTPDLITRVDTHGRLDFVNRMSKPYFGLPPEQCIGLSTFDFISPDDRAATQAAFAGWLESQAPTFRFENRILSRQGATHLMQWNVVAIRSPSGRIAGFGSIARDITQERRAQEALRAGDEMHRNILATTQDGFWIVGIADGRLLEVNPSYSRLSGYSLEELHCMTVADLEADENHIEIEIHIRKIIENGNDCFETRHRRKDGSIWHVEVNASYRDIHGGQIVAFLRDIDERKQAERQRQRYQSDLEAQVAQRTADLARALEAAQQADLAKDQFLANVSHELRTPLNAIIGLANLAQRLGAAPKPLDYLNKIVMAGKTLANIINDLLDLSKIAAGRMELDPVSFSLERLLARCRSVVSYSLAEKALPLIERIDADVPDVLRGDPLRIEQILLNLLSNAIKFTDAGQIELRIAVRARNENEIHLAFEIKDSGIGIDAADIARLFQPFAQADATMSRRYGGTGLGLALCKRLTEMMDGQISVVSEAGRGSTFKIELRLETGDADELHDDDPSACAGAYVMNIHYADVRVLAVEDQAMNREIVGELLANVGIVCHMAAHGQLALDLLQAHDPGYFDLVLMDIQMPVMDGLTATRALRADPRFATLPIVAMTAHTMEHEKQISRAAGMNDHIGKPFETESFYRLLAKWIAPEKQHERALTPLSPLPPLPPGSATDSANSALSALRGIDSAAALSRFAHNEERYRYWLMEFAADAPTYTAELRRLLATHETEPARKFAHAIKGRVGLLGMNDLHAIASAIEAAIRHGQPSGDLLDRLHQEATALCDEIHSVLKPPPPALPATLTVDRPPHEPTPPSIAALLDRFDACDGGSAAAIADCLDELGDTAWATHLQQALTHVRRFDFAAAKAVLHSPQS